MIQILLIAIISLVAQFVFPWWSIAVVAFAICFWRGAASRGAAFRGTAPRSFGAGSAFLHGFVGVALVWLAYALLVHLRTDGIFTGRMSQLLFKADAPVLLMLATAVLGGLVGGLSGLAGYSARQAMVNRPAVRNA